MIEFLIGFVALVTKCLLAAIIIALCLALLVIVGIAILYFSNAIVNAIERKIYNYKEKVSERNDCSKNNNKAL